MLVFFAFHMAIGTIMIATGTMYLLAGLTSLTAIGLYLLKAWDVFPFRAIDPRHASFDTHEALNTLSLAASLFVIVYLTGSVTSRFKQRNIDLYRATKDREDLERRKSHYMRISAHQLRSPLATVRTALQVLSDGYEDLSSERGRRLIQGAVKRVDHLLAIVNDLLNLAKIREGRGKALWSRHVDVSRLVGDVLSSFADLAEERQVELASELKGTVLLEWGIQSDLAAAFENLIENAIKYSRPGGKVMVQLGTDNRAAILRVMDNGIGIPEASLQEVFLEFVRLPDAKHGAVEGTGVGLAIVKSAVEAHGGVVLAESRERAGSTFTVSLPLRHAPPEVANATADQ